MKKTIVTLTIILTLVLALAGCGKAPAAEPQSTEASQTPAETAPVEPPASDSVPAPAPVRQDGERFEGDISDQLALELIAQHCKEQNPDLEEIINAGQYDTYWEIVSSDEREVVILFRSYTGAQVRYYVERATGDVHVTEFVPGVTPEEMPSEETLNVWDYVG